MLVAEDRDLHRDTVQTLQSSSRLTPDSAASRGAADVGKGSDTCRSVNVRSGDPPGTAAHGASFTFR